MESDVSVRQTDAFLSRNTVPLKTLVLDDPATSALCGGTACSGVTFAQEGLLEDHTPRAVARKLGLDQAVENNVVTDVLIVGGGQAVLRLLSMLTGGFGRHIRRLGTR